MEITTWHLEQDCSTKPWVRFPFGEESRRGVGLNFWVEKFVTTCVLHRKRCCTGFWQIKSGALFCATTLTAVAVLSPSPTAANYNICLAIKSPIRDQGRFSCFYIVQNKIISLEKEFQICVWLKLAKEVPRFISSVVLFSSI